MQTGRERMNQESDCPFGSGPCPKTSSIEERMDILEERQMKIIYLLYAAIGLIAAEFGVVLI